MNHELKVVTLKNNTTMVEEGCYFDSHRGQYIIDAMAELCDGFVNVLSHPTNYVDQVKQYRHVIDTESVFNDDGTYSSVHADACERLDGLYDEIENKLNDMLPDDCELSWGWNDGDFGLYRNNDDEDGES